MGQAAENKLVDMNEKTKAALNVKITAKISKLTKEANSQTEGLRLQSKEARDQMKKELLFAVRSMADVAKENLDAAVEYATGKFEAVNAQEAAAAAAAAEDRAAIADEIAVEKANTEERLRAAVATMTSSLLALKDVTRAKIAKADTRVDAYAANMEKEFADISQTMKEQMTTLTGKIEAQKESATAAISAADAASAAGFASVMDSVEAGLASAAADADDKFGTLYENMAAKRRELDSDLAASVTDINDSIAKQAALADSRFIKTVKDIEAARREAAGQVKLAREDFATGLAAVTAEIEAMDSKMTMNTQKVSGEVIAFKAFQHTVNLHVSAEINRVEKLMNAQHSESTKARGKLRAILDENRRAAHDEVTALDGLFKEKVAEIRAKAEEDAHDAAEDLTEATEKMYESMADVQAENIHKNQEHATAIEAYDTESTAAIAAAKADFTDRLDMLENVVAANHHKNERNFEVLTGVVRDFKEAGEEERALIRKQNEAMNADMVSKIDIAIQLGEAKAKAVAQRARESLEGTAQALLIEITDTVEEYADMTFKLIQGNQQAVADNYLSLKAYAVTAEEKIVAYVGHGKGKNLSSLGDLLTNIAGLSDVEVEKVTPFASGVTELPMVFSSGTIEVDNSVSKIAALVQEYVKTANECRMRWPMGLGKYLLEKLESSMNKKGVLQVDKIDGKAGNFVYVNGHAVGLSNKLNDFEGLAVRMGDYEATLAKLTASLSGKPKETAPAEIYVPPPEYDGK